MIEERRLNWLLPVGIGLALTALTGLATIAFAPEFGRNTGRRALAADAAQPAGPAAAGNIQPAPAAPVDVALAQRLEGFLQRFEAEALAKGVSQHTFQAIMRGLQPDPEVLALATSQPESVITPWEYLARLVSPARIEAGRLHLQRLETRLKIIEARYGVDRHVLTAIWGIESNYGSRQGERQVPRSLATLAASDPRRGEFWASELVEVLLMIERGETTADTLVGSWAGAMGHTQFMPSTFKAHAVDFDGDGRRDIWGRPEDAIASAANYLKASGWREGLPWGFEVRLPVTTEPARLTLDGRRTKAEWQALGVLPIRPRPLLPADNAPLDLVLPAGIAGPAFLVTRNFQALLRYNASTVYALAVGHLADRIAGEAGLVQSWPEGERLLKPEAAAELQRRLTALGFDAGTPDGIVGSKTRSAVRAYQASRGRAADGFVTERLLEDMRGEETK